MSDLKSDLMKFTTKMLMGVNTSELNSVIENQKSIRTNKLARIVEQMEDKQRLDAIFLNRIIVHINKLESNKD